MLMAGHGQINAAITEACDKHNCSQEDEDNWLSIYGAVFSALYGLVWPVAIFALLNSIMLCKAKDAWDDPQVAATDPAVGLAPMAPQALQYAPQMVQVPGVMPGQPVKVQEMVQAPVGMAGQPMAVQPVVVQTVPAPTVVTAVPNDPEAGTVNAS